MKRKTSTIMRLIEPEYLKKWLLIGVIVGVVAGFGAIAFYSLLQMTTHYFLGRGADFYPPQAGFEGGIEWKPPDNPLKIIAVITLGGLISGFLVYTFAPETEGHGTDAMIRSYHKAGGWIRARVPFVKMLASAITIGSGGSAGREGPTAQISAGLGSIIATLLKLSPEDRRLAVAVGVGAGIGSIFKAPLGGAILAAEILYRRDIEAEVLIPSFIASTIGYIIFCSYFGYNPVFMLPEISLSVVYIPFFLLLGVVCGIVGLIYIKAFYGTHKLFSKMYSRTGLPLHFKPAVGALVAGVLVVAVAESIDPLAGYGALGAGYGFLQLAMLNMIPWEIMLILAFMKIAVTSLTIGSGGSGGVFAPGLVIGGMTGGALGAILHHAFPALVPESAVPLFVVLGMISLFGGVSKAPLANMLMVSEMTGNYSLLFPAMAAVFVSYTITGDNTIYIEQVRSRADSPAHAPLLASQILSRIKVWDAATKNVVTVTPQSTVAEVISLIQKTGHMGYPVVEGGKLVGIVTFGDIKKAIAELGERRAEDVKVSDIMTRNPIVAFPDETLSDALRKLTLYNVGRLPVVDSRDRDRVIGIITRSDIVRAVTRMLLKEK